MKQRSGFTLVELSIVLVIIGLLIGGMLVAQSMISTAKIQAQIRQFSQLDTLTNNFKTQFGCLPGEVDAFHHNSPAEEASDVTPYINCDNNLGTYGGFTSYMFEPLFFFHDLYVSGLLKDPYIYSRGWVAPGGGQQFPTPALFSGQPYSVKNFFGRDYYSVVGVTGNSQGDIFWVMDMIPLVGGDSSNYFGANLGAFPLRPVEAAALDAKMDDGLPRTGNIRTYSNDGNAVGHVPADSGFWPFPVQDADGFCSTGNTYNLSGPYYSGWGQWYSTDRLCGLIVKANVY